MYLTTCKLLRRVQPGRRVLGARSWWWSARDSKRSLALVAPQHTDTKLAVVRILSALADKNHRMFRWLIFVCFGRQKQQRRRYWRANRAGTRYECMELVIKSSHWPKTSLYSMGWYSKHSLISYNISLVSILLVELVRSNTQSFSR